MIQINQCKYRWPNQEHDLLNIESLTLNQGDKLFIEGASGSGKSTLLSLLGGIILPQSGSIQMLSTTLNNLSASQRDSFRVQHLGFIFQQFNLVPYLSVIDNVTLPCHFSKQRFQKATKHGPIKTEALRLLNHMGINKEFLNKNVTELSVGQQQRVAVARALIGSPEIIIADEPTSSLDAKSQEAFIELLFQECETNNASVIFVSHDTRLAKLFQNTLTMDSISNHVKEGSVL